MSDHPPVDPAALANQLRASIQKQRPRRLLTLALTLSLAGATLLLLAWLVWPKPELPRLNVIAFDHVARPGDTITLEACLQPQDPRIVVDDLGGLDVAFESLTPPGLSRPIMVRSGSDGRTKATWQTPPRETVSEFKVFHVSLRPPYRTEDRSRLFAWKTETPVLIVEVAALADIGQGAWRASLLGEIQARDSAGKALGAASTKSYQIIYVATGAAMPLEYRLMRAWVEMKAKESAPLPEGPVLGQLPQPGTLPAAADWAGRLAQVGRQWRGHVVAVVKDPRLAVVLRDTGATTFVLTDANEVPPNTTRLPTWADLPFLTTKSTKDTKK